MKRANAESLVECLINSAIDVGVWLHCNNQDELKNAKERLDYNEQKLMKRIVKEEE